MASIEEAVLAYFQGFVPLALAFGAIISLSLVYGSIIRFLRARWNEKSASSSSCARTTTPSNSISLIFTTRFSAGSARHTTR